MDITWEEPPRKKRGHTKEFIRELKKHPGRWAKYLTWDGREYMHRNNVLYMKRRGVEAQIENHPTNSAQVRVWVRWPETESVG
jgi:hypothetical protein